MPNSPGIEMVGSSLKHIPGASLVMFPFTKFVHSYPSNPAGLFSNGKELHERVPRSWLTISLTEGKYHQVRKMVQAVGHPCKRLIRLSIEDIELEDMQPGEIRELNQEEFYKRLRLEYKALS
jgi:16S rRNA U516 pseudouridylate synthase RsuA-like enzyme